MVTKIIDGISIKINELFGDDYKIYSEDIEQGFKEPCFFISLLNPTIAPKLGDRSFRKYNFDITYFPSESNQKNTEKCSVNERLIEGLEYISIDEDLIRGSKINSEFIDGVLHFFITYNLFTVKEKTVDEYMSSVTLKQSTKR